MAAAELSLQLSSAFPRRKLLGGAGGANAWRSGAQRACFICGMLDLGVGDSPVSAGVDWRSRGEGLLQTLLLLLRLLQEK